MDGLKEDEVLGSAMEDSIIKVPKDLKRGSRIASSGVSEKKANLDSVVEDRTEEPINLRRGKRRLSSTRASKKDDTVGLVDESLQVEEVGKVIGLRLGGLMLFLLGSQEPLESDCPILNTVENIHHHKVLGGNTNQLGKSEERTYVAHYIITGGTRDNQIPDEKGLNSSNVANGSRVLPKVWNGNGITNTTPNSQVQRGFKGQLAWHTFQREVRESAVRRYDSPTKVVTWQQINMAPILGIFCCKFYNSGNE